MRNYTRETVSESPRRYFKGRRRVYNRSSYVCLNMLRNVRRCRRQTLRCRKSFVFRASNYVSKKTDYSVRNVRALQEIWGKTTKEMGIQTFPKKRRRRPNVLRQSVLQSGSGDRKSSIADG